MSEICIVWILTQYDVWYWTNACYLLNESLAQGMEDNVSIFSFWDYLSMDRKSNGRGVVKVFAKWSFPLILTGLWFVSSPTSSTSRILTISQSSLPVLWPGDNTNHSSHRLYRNINCIIYKKIMLQCFSIIMLTLISHLYYTVHT